MNLDATLISNAYSSPRPDVPGRPLVTGLLVSVRSVDEARQIASLPVEVIDLKEPARGALGACDPEVWHRCLVDSPFEGDWSAALGEAESAIELAAKVPASFAFAKAGAAGIDDRVELANLWGEIRERLPASVALVAVAYADWLAAGSLAPEQVLQEAAAAGLRTLLIDTFAKDGRSIAAHLSHDELRLLVAKAKAFELEIVVAGGVTLGALPSLISLPVRRVGVRGGVCEGNRESRIDPLAVARWIERLRQLNRRETIR